MKKLRDKLLRLFRRPPAAHIIPRLPVGMELSDGDRAALYGWPDCRVEEIEHEIP